jgi:hypothetical protein
MCVSPLYNKASVLNGGCFDLQQMYLKPDVTTIREDGDVAPPATAVAH